MRENTRLCPPGASKVLISYSYNFNRHFQIKIQLLTKVWILNFQPDTTNFFTEKTRGLQLESELRGSGQGASGVGMAKRNGRLVL